MIKISFIIPAYNVEKYIERCLTSIYNQGIDESLYEVIVVDDGSTDGTFNLLNNRKDKHNNLIIATQNNQGVSAARNRGMSLANGEYLWFVDSDDYIVNGALSHLWNNLNNDIIDALFFNCLVEETNGKRYEALQQPVSKNVIMSGETALNQGFYPASSCNAIWRKKYIEELQLVFNTGVKYGEDSLFVFSAILPSISIKFIENPLYIYCKREGSATTTKHNKDKLLLAKYSDIAVIKSIRDLYMKYEHINPTLSELAQKQYQSILFGLVYSVFKNRKTWKHNGMSRTIIDRLKKEELYPLKGPFHSFKKWIMSRVLNYESLMT